MDDDFPEDLTPPCSQCTRDSNGSCNGCGGNLCPECYAAGWGACWPCTRLEVAADPAAALDWAQLGF